ncbi:hypothetical protein ABEB36_014350 [Hypothenemus hampei]|uniref:WH2 domain-containing protein n=1 Tax=Hypothenemus hampei TaxID=57062 RepID=A0ABD1E550_HYPHA
MPTGAAAKGGSNPSGRTTFRPPWVKEGAEPTDALNPCNLKSVPKKRESPSKDSDANNPIDGVQLRKVKKKDYDRESLRKEKENNPLAGVKLRKTSVQTKEPQQNGEEKESFFVKPQLKPVPQREKSPPKKDYKIHDLPKLNKVEERKLSERKPSMLRKDSTFEDEEIDRINGNKSKELPAKRNSLVRNESVRKFSQGPAPPPMPPPPPCMPGETPKKPLSNKQTKKLELLKSRPKVRPDWSATLKEIEGGKKLRHVECNDRSNPILPEGKAQEHFLYDSEKPNVHNELLKQIEGGFKLKKVQTNDRSKPMLEGLRKFRRQMTIEEQIQKSMSMASIPPDDIAPEEVDELDDIDKVRDDLQSTKQMLALELRNKEAQEMENKRLLSRLANLEAELEKMKTGGNHGKSNTADDKVIQSLKKEAEQSRKSSEQMEKKYTEAMKTLDTTKLQLEDYKRKNLELEKKLIDALGGKIVSISGSRQNSIANGDGNDDLEEDETEEESDGEDTPEKREKKMEKEVKQLGNKLRNFKNKEDNAKKERIALKVIIKKHQAAIKEEKKRYNKIKKEVDKMEAMLKAVSEDDEDDDEEKEEDEDEEVEEEESSEEESESESETDDSDSEKSLSEPEDAPLEKKKTNLVGRTKRHEARLGALKKGNFLLKTNAERLQDDLNKQKEMTASLQEELDSVLSELG